MKLLLTADLHQTDRPLDAYRWGLFPWLQKQVKKHSVERVAILGDATDSKDKHAEPLANRFMSSLAKLGEVADVIFLPGNHDGIQEGRPYFRFSSYIPNVRCVTKPLTSTADGKRTLFLPNTRDYKTAWEEFGDFKEFDYIFCHQTFDGCLSENGTALSGIPPSVFGKTKAKIYSGDIHRPQRIGCNIEYVGAPYRIRFGDDFEPRVVLLDTISGKQSDLHFPTVMKFLIELSGEDCERAFALKIKKLDIQENDQVKIRVSLPRSDYANWPAIRKSLKEISTKAGLVLKGPELVMMQANPKGTQKSKQASGSADPAKALDAYGKREAVSGSLLKAGKGFLGEALGMA